MSKEGEEKEMTDFEKSLLMGRAGEIKSWCKKCKKVTQSIKALYYWPNICRECGGDKDIPRNMTKEQWLKERDQKTKKLSGD